MEVALMYILTILIPIHGIFFLGYRNETEKRRKLLKSLIQYSRGRK